MPSPPFRLSVLDQSPISEGSSGAQALRNTIDLAQLADRLGYHRYWAAELGLPYAFADFINPKGAEIAALYRERFAEHEHVDLKPRVAVGVWVICAESDEQARRLATSGRMTFTLLRRGQLIAVPSPEIAVEFLEADDRTPGQPRSGRRAVVGSPETVRAELEDVVEKYGAEEAIVVSITYAHEARRRSYELLAEAFGL